MKTVWDTPKKVSWKNERFGKKGELEKREVWQSEFKKKKGRNEGRPGNDRTYPTVILFLPPAK